jgi:hypothetical protein
MSNWWVLNVRCGLTTNYHDDGSAVVFAATEAEARDLLAKHVAEDGVETPLEIESCEPLSADVPVRIFPDAGCC